MNEDDIEFIQILNIIKRGQRLVIQAKNSGIDTSKAEEYINEAKYALRLGNRDAAIEYSKKCMLDVIQTKREQDKVALSKEGALEELTKAELRRKCQELGLNPVGLKEELVKRLRKSLSSVKVTEEPAGKPEEEKAPARKEPAPLESQPVVQLQKIVEDQITHPTEEKASQGEAPGPAGAEERPSRPVKKVFNAKEETSKMITGLSYLVEEQRADKIYHLYNELKKEDRIGFAISRSNPKLLQRTYKVDITEFMWLTDRDVGGDIRSVPPSLESIIYYIEEFIDKYPEGVILMDGLEYLIGNNTFNPVIRFLRRLVDRISTTQCILLVSLAPETLDQSQVTLLEKDLYPLDYSSGT